MKRNLKKLNLFERSNGRASPPISLIIKEIEGVSEAPRQHSLSINHQSTKLF